MTTTSIDIARFRIDIDGSVLDDLHDRLGRTRFGAALPGDDWNTGVPSEYLRELVQYWRDEFDWRLQEARINEFPQFTTEIDGQNIHFLHIRSAAPDALPLILTHGWPGSFVEFLDIIGPLTDPESYGGKASDAFHLVIPSLPGFGFSGPVSENGWTITRTAHAWATLMSRLGYVRYGAHGGDIGAAVSPATGRVDPSHVVGVHTNGGPGPMPALPVPPEDLATLTDLERGRVTRIEQFMRQEFGYIAIQSTRPAALGPGLADSPVGQLAWIIDKFREWTYPRTQLPDAIIDRDRLLTNVMIYWLTNTAASSAYVGYSQSDWGAPDTSSGVPTGAIVFAHDVGIRRYAEQANNITHWVDIEDRGGHFAAMEEPTVLVDDMRLFFRAVR